MTSVAKRLSLGAGLLIAVVLLYVSLRHVQWREVAEIVSRARAGWLAGAGALTTMTLFLRAVRWRVLLNAGARVDVPTAFWATAAGYFGNNFLPARAGELVRTLLISSRTSLDTPYVLATAISERIADALTLVGIAVFVLLRTPEKAAWMASAVRFIGITVFACAGAIAILPRLSQVLHRLIDRSPLPPPLGARLDATMGSVLTGMRAFHDAKRFAAFGALTAVIWTGDAVAFVLTGASLDLVIPLHVSFLLLAALGLGSALPSTPGYIGIYQFVAVMVLPPFGFSRSDAIAYILVTQALGYVVVGVWGAIALVRHGLPRKSLET